MKPIPTNETHIPNYRVCRCSCPIKIDGHLDKSDWTTADPIPFTKFEHQPEDSKPLRQNTEVKALWDDQNLYLAFRVQDCEVWASMRNHDARLFLEECVEIFVDPDGDGRKYVELQINSLGTVRDLLIDGDVENPTYAQYDTMARWHFANLKKAVHIYRDNLGNDTGWTLEMAIPWCEFAFSYRQWPPTAGNILRVNFYRFERSRTGKLPLELSGWSKVRGSFHQPRRFGIFVFSSFTTSSR